MQHVKGPLRYFYLNAKQYMYIFLIHFYVHEAGTGRLTAIIKWTSKQNVLWNPSSMFQRDNERTFIFSSPLSLLLNLNKLCLLFGYVGNLSTAKLFFQRHYELFVIQMNAFVSCKCFHMENNS